MTGVLITRDQDSYTHRDDHVGTQGEDAVYTPRREASEPALPTPESQPSASAALEAVPGVRLRVSGLLGFRGSEWVSRATGSCLDCSLIPNRDMCSQKGHLESSSEPLSTPYSWPHSSRGVRRAAWQLQAPQSGRAADIYLLIFLSSGIPEFGRSMSLGSGGQGPPEAFCGWWESPAGPRGLFRALSPRNVSVFTAALPRHGDRSMWPGREV